MKKRFLAVIFIVVFLIARTAFAAPSQEKPEAFYRGKVISLYTADAGSSGDALARVLSKILGQELGAKVIVENHPGGGTLQTINLTYKARPDGLILLIQEVPGITLSGWFHDPGAVWDVAKFNWLALAASQPGIGVVSPEKPYQSIKDLQNARGIKLGASTPMGFYGTTNCLVASLLNLDAKVISGLKGTSGVILSIQKGELDGGTLPEDVAARCAQAKQVRPLFVLSGKSPLFPDLPVLTQVVKPTADQTLLIDLLSTVRKAIVTTPGVPKDRVDFLRKTIRKICDDKNVQKEIMDKTGIAGWYGFVPGDEAQKTMSDPTIGPKVKRLLEAIFERYMVR